MAKLRTMLALMLLAVASAPGEPVIHVEAPTLAPEAWEPEAWSVEREYQGYLESLELTDEQRSRLLAFLEDRDQRRQELREEGEKLFSSRQDSNAELVVVTFDRRSQYAQKLDTYLRKNALELYDILTYDQVQTYKRYLEEQKRLRRREALGKEADALGLKLDEEQRERVITILDNKPDFYQSPVTQSATVGYSQAYLEERERWRYEQQQYYLDEEILPLLSDEQVDSFRAWQQEQNEAFEERMSAWSASGETGAFAEKPVRILVPAPLPPLAVWKEKRRIFVECREEQFFHIPVEAMNFLTGEKLRSVAREARGQPGQLVSRLRDSHLDTDVYRLDISTALQGYYSIIPKRGVIGHPLRENIGEKGSWLHRLLDSANPNADAILLLVRQDGFRASNAARTVAEELGFSVDEEFLADGDIIQLQLAGMQQRTVIDGRTP